MIAELRAQLGNTLKIILTLVAALLLGAVIMWATGQDALQAYGVLWDSAVGNSRNVANSLLAATPIIMTGLATLIAFRAGIFNIGVEGSLYVGAFAAAWVGFTFVNAPGWVLIPACLLAGGLVGGVWGFIPGVLKARLRVDEVVTTLLLNYVAILLTGWLVTGPFLVPGMANAMSAEIAEQAQLPRLLARSQWNAGFFIALGTVVLVGFMIRRLTLGYEIRTVGSNPMFARWSGIPVGRVIMQVMFISGFIGGVAGAIQVMGVNYRFIGGFSRGLGFDGITVALLGRNTPLGTMLAALFFGGLRSGSSTMEMFTQVPRDLVDILQAIIILFVAIDLTFTWTRFRRRSSGPGAGKTAPSEPTPAKVTP
jgi:general nucleoside transport system permease protein